MDLNIGQMCRACLRESPDILHSLQWPDVRRIFHECTQLKVPVLDALPQQLCFPCFRKCQEWNLFRIMCTENQQHLMDTLVTEPTNITRSVLTSQIKTEPIDIHEEQLHWNGKKTRTNKSQRKVPEETDSSSSEEELGEDETSIDDNDEQGIESPPRQTSYTCDRCNKQYYYLKPFNKHMLICTLANENSTETDKDNERPMAFSSRCLYCPERFPNSKLRDDHMRDKHKIPRNERDKQFRCKECNLSFEFAYQLRVHMIKRHPKPVTPAKSKSGVCQLCDKIVRNLAEHEKAHTLSMGYHDGLKARIERTLAVKEKENGEKNEDEMVADTNGDAVEHPQNETDPGLMVVEADKDIHTNTAMTVDEVTELVTNLSCPEEIPADTE